MDVIEISNKILERIEEEVQNHYPHKAFASYLIGRPNDPNYVPRLKWLIKSPTGLNAGRYLNTNNEISRNSPFGNAVAELNNEPGEELTYRVNNKEIT
jgi:hypothetical protein